MNSSTLCDGWRLRPATLSDLDVVTQTEQQLFPTDAWSRRMICEELSSEHSYYLVVVPESCTAPIIGGYAGLRAPWDLPQADIQTIGLLPELRGRGLGRLLMVSLHKEAYRRGAREVFLEVRADNPIAQSLYLSLGYEQIDLRRGYYQPDNVDALVMRARLPSTAQEAAS